MQRSSLDPLFIEHLVAGSCGKVLNQTRITTGLSGAEVYALTTERGDFVLRRFFGPKPEWQRSVVMYRKTSGAGITPKVSLVNDEYQIIVMQRINASSFGSALHHPNTKTAAQEQLASLLSTMQTIETDGEQGRDLTEFASGLWHEQSVRAHFPAWAQPLSDELRRCGSILKSDDRRAFCHGDLNPANLLWDGKRLWVVDLDSAGVSHPFVDLATICNFLSVTDEDAFSILERIVLRTADVNDKEIFLAMRQFARIVYGMVFLRLIPELADAAFKPLSDTRTLPECFALTNSGQVTMGEPVGAGMIAAAFLRQAHENNPLTGGGRT